MNEETDWTPEQDDELTPESLVSRLLNQAPTVDNFIRGVESLEILLMEAVDKSKQTEY